MYKSSLALLGFTTSALFAGTTAQVCPPEPGAPCYTVDDSLCQYCLGPEVVNPAVGPLTCNGDWNFTVAGIYWQAHQDGLEFAIKTNVPTPVDQVENIALIDAKYISPKFKWNFGFKLGLSYTSDHDGWDFGVLWTSFCSDAFNHEEVEQDDNTTLITLWTLLRNEDFLTSFANDIESRWKLNLDLIDIELGRDFWTSQYLSLRPHLGLRVAYIDQRWNMAQTGDQFYLFDSEHVFDIFNLKNKYHGVGVIGGLDSTWHLGRGFSLFGDAAVSLIYGKFEVQYGEQVRRTSPPFTRLGSGHIDDAFKATRYMVDLALGVEWETMFYECKYSFSIRLAYEQHLFLNQNQFFRFQPFSDNPPVFENVYYQNRGDLDTQGLTLTVKFAF